MPVVQNGRTISIISNMQAVMVLSNTVRGLVLKTLAIFFRTYSIAAEQKGSNNIKCTEAIFVIIWP
jgi:hypothetical protein